MIRPPVLTSHPVRLTVHGAYRCPAQTHRNGLVQQCRCTTQRGKPFCAMHARAAAGLPGLRQKRTEVAT
jgi:hypothetical protein